LKLKAKLQSSSSYFSHALKCGIGRLQHVQHGFQLEGRFNIFVFQALHPGSFNVGLNLVAIYHFVVSSAATWRVALSTSGFNLHKPTLYARYVGSARGGFDCSASV
jgi:hypothetical protein